MIRIDLQDTSIATKRLSLSALIVDDADEMVSVLGDQRLHNYIDGQPPTIDELRVRYRRFVAGPDDPSTRWLNWIVRTRRDQVPIGTLQATISAGPEGSAVADVAWIIGIGWQGHGYATEAARAVIPRLNSHGVDQGSAHIHPDHTASAIVASRAGLHLTAEQHHGEMVWRLTESGLS